MLELICAGDKGLKIVQQMGESAQCYIDVVRYAPVITGMEKILCVGKNYAAHAKELGDDLPTEPCIFNKLPNALAAHEEEITLPISYTHFDYEAEMVIVIGRTLKDASYEEASNAIFGYTIGNDISNREAQFSNGQWLMGKSSDGFGPIGPCLITADSIDVSDISVQSYVNGELRQNGRTRDLIFRPSELLQFISRHLTLRPGDVVFSGTPAGVITGYPKEKQVWLKAGDVVEIHLGGIGVLRNTLK